MINFAKKLFVLCGILLGLAAFPVLAQKTEPLNEVLINKRPLKDFAEIAKQKILSDEVDLDKEFSVSLVGVITKDGKFDLSRDEKTKQPKTRITKTEGDAQMIELTKQAIEAVGDSGWFGYLRSQGIEKFNLTVSQDTENFSVVILNQQPTPEKARTYVSALNSLVNAVVLMDKNGTRKLGDNERKLLNGTKATAREKNVSIIISLPKAEFQEMIRQEINRSEQQPNG